MFKYRWLPLTWLIMTASADLVISFIVYLVNGEISSMAFVLSTSISSIFSLAITALLSAANDEHLPSNVHRLH